MDGQEYYALARSALAPEFPAICPLPRTGERAVSPRVRVVGAEGGFFVETRRDAVRLSELFEAYADAAGVEDAAMLVQLSQGFRLFDDEGRVVESASRATFGGRCLDWDGHSLPETPQPFFPARESPPYLLVIGSFAVPCEGLFYGEVESSRDDAVETGEGTCAALALSASPDVSNLSGHRGDPVSVMCGQFERRRFVGLDDTAAARLLAVYGVRAPGAAVGVLGEQTPLVSIPAPASLCDYEALAAPARRCVQLSREKGLAALRRVLPRADEDVVRTVARCDAPRLRWLGHDAKFAESAGWRFSLLVREVGRGGDSAEGLRARSASREGFFLKSAASPPFAGRATLASGGALALERRDAAIEADGAGGARRTRERHRVSARDRAAQRKARVRDAFRFLVR